MRIQKTITVEEKLWDAFRTTGYAMGDKSYSYLIESLMRDYIIKNKSIFNEMNLISEEEMKASQKKGK